MQNSLSFLKQTFEPTINSIKNTLNINLHSKLSKVIALISFAISSFFISFKILSKKEINIACSKLSCKPEDVIKLSKRDFDKLDKSILDRYKINIKDHFTTGFMGNIFTSNQDDVYAKLAVATEAKEDKNHPLHRRSYCSLEFVKSTDSLIKHLGKIGSPIPRIKGSLVIGVRALINKLFEISEDKYKNDACVSMFCKEEFNDLIKAMQKIDKSKSDDDFFEIGQSNGSIYVAHTSKAFDKYSKFRIRYININNFNKN